MKVESVHQFTERDPMDIREMSAGELARKQKRVKLMRKFLWWAYWKESKRWTESNNEERIIVHRQFSHFRFMAGFGFIASVLVYNAFFRGIYNFRSRELVNMRHVPFTLKLGLSAFVGIAFSRDMHLKAIYDPDLYRIALKYRTYYDAEYQKLADNPLPVQQQKV